MNSITIVAGGRPLLIEAQRDERAHATYIVISDPAKPRVHAALEITDDDQVLTRIPKSQ